MGLGGQHHAPAALPPGKTRYPMCRGWVSPRAVLNGCGKSRPCRDSIPGPSSPWRFFIPTDLSRLKVEGPKTDKRTDAGLHSLEYAEVLCNSNDTTRRHTTYQRLTNKSQN